jgi:hypothetical protein
MARIELIDVDRAIHETTPGVGPRGPFRVDMQRLAGGLSEGVDVVTVGNGRVTLQVLPTRGMGVWRGEADGVPLRWNSPVQRPVHPSFVDPMRRGGIGWLDGFNELICRCGLGWHGAPGTDIQRGADGSVLSEQFLPLHGRIANLPAHRVFADVTPAAVQLTGVIDEGSLFGGWLRLTSVLTLRDGESGFSICDTVQNLSSAPAEVEMLYHCNIGEPFLGKDSILHTASTEVAPRDARAAEGISMWNMFEGPTAGYAEQVYFTRAAAGEDDRGLAVLADADSQHAIAVRFQTDTLPWFVLWKNTQAEVDGYVAGLEPASSFPNPRMAERAGGRVIQLPAGQEVVFRLDVDVATTASATRALLDEVTELQVRTPRTVHRAPKPEWG